MKEGAFWRGSAVRVFAVGGVLITAAAIALCTPWFDLVDLREVVITGNRHASAADLVSMSGLQRGQSLLAVSLRRVASNLMQHPWTKEVRLSRRLPHTLAIRVVEREEIAWMIDPSGDGCITVGEEGVIVSAGCPHSTSLIELQGARVSGGVGGTLADRPIVVLIDALRREGLASLDVRRIDAADPESVVLDTGSDQRVLLGGLHNVASAVNALAALHRAHDLSDYEVVDLRFGGEATLVPR